MMGNEASTGIMYCGNHVHTNVAVSAMAKNFTPFLVVALLLCIARKRATLGSDMG